MGSRTRLTAMNSDGGQAPASGPTMSLTTGRKVTTPMSLHRHHRKRGARDTILCTHRVRKRTTRSTRRPRRASPRCKATRPRLPRMMTPSVGVRAVAVRASRLGAEQAELGPKPLSGGSARVVLDPLAAAAVAARRQCVGRVVEAHRPTAAIRAAIASDARFFTYVVHEHSPRLPTQIQADVNSLSDPGRVGAAIRGGSSRPEITPAGTPGGGVALCRPEGRFGHISR